MSKFSKRRWLPRKISGYYFYRDSDEYFKKKHPSGYVFLVILGMAVLFLPLVIYVVSVAVNKPDANNWLLLGAVGAFIIGIGLFNFVAIIIKQYLGHLVSIVSFVVGTVMIAISIRLM